LKTKDSELCSGAVARKAKVSVAGVWTGSSRCAHTPLAVLYVNNISLCPNITRQLRGTRMRSTAQAQPRINQPCLPVNTWKRNKFWCKVMYLYFNLVNIAIFTMVSCLLLGCVSQKQHKSSTSSLMASAFCSFVD
jgi:hypothetical protein